MFTHRICTGRIGSAAPTTTAVSKTSASPPLVGKVQVMNLTRLS
jgi:hypothetical protein